ncbi:hypothetical protein MNB_SV-14-994 [hydrothermal vent metagenome]|uniref:Uncharacterized protein n=1 Tax=hydrothermal vent metagenome TaxID=652676 RepID=A0A1W1CV04_9ZZZZ
MENSKYLPVGSNIGGHYEIIDVLGDDDFEILYLVRDNNRRGSFFVLKELFLETFSSRSGESVFTIPEAQGVFDKRKKEIILEIDFPKKRNKIDRDEVKTYGYIKDNNTIYTVMEFNNNFDLKNYLHFKPRDEIILPPLDLITKKSDKKSFLFLKILIIAIIVFAGLAFYAYKMLKEDRDKPKEKPKVVVTQTPINHPALITRTEIPKKEVKVEESKIEEPKKVPSGAEYIPVDEIPKKDTIKTENSSEAIVQDNSIYIDNETEEIPKPKEASKTITNVPEVKTPIIKEEVKTVPKKEVKTPIIEESKNISLGTRIQTVPHHNVSLGTPIVKKSTEPFTREAIKEFLDDFIASSATGSVEDIASKYDYHVDRYFSLKNVTHTTIKRDKRRYNRKWTHREFKIKNFKILKKYKKDGTDYCDIKTTTKWRVSTNRGKKASGTSRGFMTIKRTDNGFKVKSIYTLR